ncbi:MAG: hypothetical protein M5U28_37800 [Sandaracinaceae bacterium]|nr:hypothetical protein [Sandaracinaceae bacterium]
MTDENVHAVERTYWRFDPADPARLAWRDALVAYRSARTEEIVARGEYDEVIEHLARLTELLDPADVEAGRVPAEVAPLARWVVEHGSPRGDEGRVMAALMLLAALGEDPEANREARDRIRIWGRDARASVDNPIERYGDLIQVWEQHEELAPAPEVLTTLARLYVEQRDALALAFGPEGHGRRSPGRISLRELQLAPMLVQRAPSRWPPSTCATATSRTPSSTCAAWATTAAWRARSCACSSARSTTTRAARTRSRSWRAASRGRGPTSARPSAASARDASRPTRASRSAWRASPSRSAGSAPRPLGTRRPCASRPRSATSTTRRSSASRS